jgi:5-methyltetrahydrofolate--homocysteine methyltransferase
VIGTVKGDLHDIGKNLVGMMIESNGFEVIDLGIDISPDTFIQAIKDEKPDIVAMSALLTTTRPVLEETIRAFVAAGVREHCKVIVGGAPIDQEYADRIGADGYAPDGPSAAELCKRMMTA